MMSHVVRWLVNLLIVGGLSAGDSKDPRVKAAVYLRLNDPDLESRLDPGESPGEFMTKSPWDIACSKSSGFLDLYEGFLLQDYMDSDEYKRVRQLLAIEHERAQLKWGNVHKDHLENSRIELRAGLDKIIEVSTASGYWSLDQVDRCQELQDKLQEIELKLIMLRAKK